MKKHWHILVGVAVVLLAVLIVLGSIFIPRLAAKSDMKELLALVAASDAQYVVLVDPTYKNPGVLAGEGREVRLEGELLKQTRDAIGAISQGFSYKEKQSEEGKGFGLHLLVKSTDGTSLKLYFTSDAFYAVLKGNAYYFTANDAQAYTALYNALLAAF